MFGLVSFRSYILDRREKELLKPKSWIPVSFSSVSAQLLRYVHLKYSVNFGETSFLLSRKGDSENNLRYVNNARGWCTALIKFVTRNRRARHSSTFLCPTFIDDLSSFDVSVSSFNFGFVAALDVFVLPT